MVIEGGQTSVGAAQSPTVTGALHVAVVVPWLTVNVTKLVPNAYGGPGVCANVTGRPAVASYDPLSMLTGLAALHCCADDVHTT